MHRNFPPSLRVLAVAGFLTLPLRAEVELFMVWQVVLGGMEYEECTGLWPTGDGGCVVIGGSESGVSGNKSSGNQGSADFWIVRLDGGGTKLWDEAHGGTQLEYPNGVLPSADGGWLVAGQSASDTGGNKSSPRIGGRDFWLVKTDAEGGKDWEAAYGGTGSEICWGLAGGPDHYLLPGQSASGVSGNKSSGNAGRQDFFAVKVDSGGGRIWDASFGGADFDWCYAATPTSDDGFLLVGESVSEPGEGKTSPYYGSGEDGDGWVVKIDANGEEQWQQSLGGTEGDYLSLAMQTADGGYLVGGASASGSSGNKTSGNNGFWDWWLAKLDASGTVLWDKVYGGDQSDYLKGLLPFANGYLLYGTSWSGATGDKSDPSHGESDYWLVHIDRMGNKLADWSFGGEEEDYAVEAFQPSSDGGFLLGGYSESPATGNKTLGTFGSFDYWVVKIAPAPTLTIARGSPGEVVLSWEPEVPGFGLQESPALNPPAWTDAEGGSSNPAIVPVTTAHRFFRLYKP